MESSQYQNTTTHQLELELVHLLSYVISDTEATSNVSVSDLGDGIQLVKIQVSNMINILDHW